jgi:hypothetical protein
MTDRVAASPIDLNEAPAPLDSVDGQGEDESEDDDDDADPDGDVPEHAMGTTMGDDPMAKKKKKISKRTAG